MDTKTNTRTAGVTVATDGKGRVAATVFNTRTLGRIAARMATNVLSVGFLPTCFTDENDGRVYHDAVVHVRLTGQSDYKAVSKLIADSDKSISPDATSTITMACQAIEPVAREIARMASRTSLILPLGEVDQNNLGRTISIPYGLIHNAILTGRNASESGAYFAQVIGGYVLNDKDEVVRMEGGVLVGGVDVSVLLSWQHVAIIQEMIGVTDAQYRFDRRFRECPRSFQRQQNIEVKRVYQEQLLEPLAKHMQFLAETYGLIGKPAYDKLRFDRYGDLTKQLLRCRDLEHYNRLMNQLLELDADSLPFKLEQLLSEPMSPVSGGKANRLAFYQSLRLHHPIIHLFDTLVSELGPSERAEIAVNFHEELCVLIGDALQAHGEQSRLHSLMAENYDPRYRDDR